MARAGYDRIGMDDNWQACGAGINGSFHSAAGAPLSCRSPPQPSHTHVLLLNTCSHGHLRGTEPRLMRAGRVGHVSAHSCSRGSPWGSQL